LTTKIKKPIIVYMIRLSKEIIPTDVLEEIVTLGEGYKTEFKATLPSPASVAKSLCAFANTKGGNLFIGINNSSIPVGVIDKEFELRRLEKAFLLVIPCPDYSVKIINFKNNEIILIEVKEGKNKPYFVKNGQKTMAYIRAGDVNLPATRKTLRAFIHNQKPRFYGEKTLKKDEKIVYNLFDKEKKLSVEKIRESLNYSPRRLKKILLNLTKYGLIVPSKNEKTVFYKTKDY
jgi:predicted HTH transcriptional regulator